MERYDSYKEFAKKGGPPKNAETAEKIYPYVVGGLYSLYLARLFINIASLKWPKLLKGYLYIEILIFTFE